MSNLLPTTATHHETGRSNVLDGVATPGITINFTIAPGGATLLLD